MLKHIIFHLNILADPILLRRHYQHGLAKIMQNRYGKTEQFWADIQEQIFADWASYHADLNYSSDDGMRDMREGRFRVTRALFRLAGIPEPSKQEITQLAEDLISEAPKYGDAFSHGTKDLLAWLNEKNLSITLISYYPEIQLRAILSGGQLDKYTGFAIGADTFEQYEMDRRYFEYLLNKLHAQAPECLYVDNQETMLTVAEKIGMKILCPECDSLPHQLQKFVEQSS